MCLEMVSGLGAEVTPHGRPVKKSQGHELSGEDAWVGSCRFRAGDAEDEGCSEIGGLMMNAQSVIQHPQVTFNTATMLLLETRNEGSRRRLGLNSGRPHCRVS